MPSSVADLLSSVNLEPGGSVPWGDPVPERRTGIYLISLNESPDEARSSSKSPPIDSSAIGELLEACPSLTLDERDNPDPDLVSSRMGEFWLPDECVLYIGLSGQPLRTRVRQYYTTPLGAAKPHAGGWWLKALSNVSDLFVHFAVTDQFKAAEEGALDAFAAGVSPESRRDWPEGEPLMPFANLRDGQWRRRDHGIKGATSAMKRRLAQSNPTGPESRGQSGSLESQERPSPKSLDPHFRSQNITAKDIEAGQIRFPSQTKSLFPLETTQVEFLLRGRALTGRWNPRLGPPEKSGTLRIGRDNASELLRASEVLTASTDADGLIRLD